MSLLTFSGNVCDWPHFRDTFQTLIVDNAYLSNVQRLHYLISSLRDEAQALIQNLLVMNANFTIKGFISPTYAQYSCSSVIHPYTYFSLLLAILRGVRII